MSDLPVAIQLESYLPPECRQCDTAFEACRVMAREVIARHLDIEQAGSLVAEELQANCTGAATIAMGWAAVEVRCRNSLVV